MASLQHSLECKLFPKSEVARAQHKPTWCGTSSWCALLSVGQGRANIKQRCRLAACYTGHRHMGSPKLDQAAEKEPGGKWEGRKEASPGPEDIPELQPGAQVRYWHIEDAQDWTSKEGAALGGGKSEDTGKFTQNCRCTVIDPRKPRWSPCTPAKVTVPTQKRSQASTELLVRQHSSQIMLVHTPLIAVDVLALHQPDSQPENTPKAATRGDFEK